ncbi:MAG: DUF2100 domain-containing protein [Candidatus Jordarchaeaceae archaeon]
MDFEYDDIVRINSALDALVAILCRVRAFAPRYDFDSATEEEIKRYFKIVQDALNFSVDKIGVERKQEKKNVETRTVKLEGVLFITVSSFTRRKLLDLGVDPGLVVVTGGPLDAADVKVLNPSISDAALETVRKKVETVWRDIEKKSLKAKRILVLVEKGNKGDLMIAKKADEIQRRTGLKTFVKTFSSLQDLSGEFFEEFLGDANV